jgi:catecholate siderophore receptor
MTAIPLANVAPVSATPLGFKTINGYWIFNLMIRRPISDRLDFQANLTNLTTSRIRTT